MLGASSVLAGKIRTPRRVGRDEDPWQLARAGRRPSFP